MSDAPMPAETSGKTAAILSSPRKARIRALSEDTAHDRERWIRRNRFYHQSDQAYFQFLVPPGKAILVLGASTGHLAEALQPARCVGVDFSGKRLALARARFPQHTFIEGDVEDPELMDALLPHGPFDFIIIPDTLGFLEDCQGFLSRLHGLCDADTRLVVAYYSWFWEPVLSLAQWVGLHIPQVEVNWMGTEDIKNFLALADFDTVNREWRQLFPRWAFGLGTLINRFIAPLPWLRRLCLRNYVVARSLRQVAAETLSATVLVPCRNEKGNIEAAILRTPPFCADLEFIFVEGGSSDGTYEECLRVQARYPHKKITVMKQPGVGKGDAVRAGFSAATGDVFMILDADLTMPPEDLPKFYDAIASGKGEFINGSRLVYPMEDEAMRFLNFWANRVFSWLFTWLLNQRFSDTLCGTKVLRKKHYERIVAARSYFGEFDPFGDFDLIFGAIKQNLKVVEVPIRYAARRYGETQISRFRHGVLLLRMVLFAFRKLKAF